MGFFSRVFGDVERRRPTPAKSGRVDPSTMSTQVGRQMAERVNRSLDESEMRVHRLGQVLGGYETYADSLQLELAEAAIVWTCASLAAHRTLNNARRIFVP